MQSGACLQSRPAVPALRRIGPRSDPKLSDPECNHRPLGYEGNSYTHARQRQPFKAKQTLSWRFRDWSGFGSICTLFTDNSRSPATSQCSLRSHGHVQFAEKQALALPWLWLCHGSRHAYLDNPSTLGPNLDLD